MKPKFRLTFSGLYGGLSQKIELFVATSVRTSNPTMCSGFWAWLFYWSIKLFARIDIAVACFINAELITISSRSHYLYL
jgi:hypothetical protein